MKSIGRMRRWNICGSCWAMIGLWFVSERMMRLCRRQTQTRCRSFCVRWMMEKNCLSGGMKRSRNVSWLREWLLSRLDSKLSRRLLRECLSNTDEEARHVALQSISLNRDKEAVSKVMAVLQHDTDGNRRVAAEALGRIGDRTGVPQLLNAADKAGDRILQHSIVYALIELADAAETRRGLSSKSPKIVAAACWRSIRCQGATSRLRT